MKKYLLLILIPIFLVGCKSTKTELPDFLVINNKNCKKVKALKMVMADNEKDAIEQLKVSALKIGANTVKVTDLSLAPVYKGKREITSLGHIYTSSIVLSNDVADFLVLGSGVAYDCEKLTNEK